MGSVGSLAAAAGAAAQLRREVRGLRSAGVWRSADNGSGVARTEVVSPCAADLHGRCRRHQLIWAAHRGVSSVRRRSARMRPMRRASSPSASISAAFPPTRSAVRCSQRRWCKPEDERHIEFGIKTELVPGITANVTVFNTEINDFQAQVVNANVGVLRGYLANAEKVRVRGVEFDGNARVNRTRLLYSVDRLHRWQVRLVQGRAAAARGDGWTAGEGHLGLGPRRDLQMGAFLRRRVLQSGDGAGSLRRFFRRQ